MKGKIDSDGMLRIYRGDANPDHYQHQYCPFNNTTTGEHDNLIPTQCGCWCPLFGEPEKTNNELLTNIELCHGKTLVFDDFIDDMRW